MDPRCLLYAGPTLHRAMAMARLPLGDLAILPPIRRGDVDRAIRSAREPGVLAIVDGYFHLQVLAVGHAEIRRALSAGWQVWGVASMGAIRGSEMRDMGMHGWGRAFETYCADPAFRDDEVSLLHEQDPPYRELSEPLLHIRAALDDLVADDTLTSTARDAIVSDLMGRWFGERTLALLRKLLQDHQVHGEQLTPWWAGFDKYRVKAHDLISFLAAKPWLDRGGGSPPIPV